MLTRVERFISVPLMIQILSFVLIVVTTHAHAETPIKASALEGRRIQSAYRKRIALEKKFKRGIEVVCRHRTLIISAARTEKVNPRHMIGCLLSEYTYLKDAIDVAVDIAAYAGFYWDPSLGFTQIKLSTARVIAHELYDEKVIADEHVIHDLLNPRTATQYMARLIHNIVEDYRRAGFDIDGSTGLVCSSYLVGNSGLRARNHKRNGTLPDLNDYGRFAIKNEATVLGIESGARCR